MLDVEDDEEDEEEVFSELDPDEGVPVELQAIDTDSDWAHRGQ